MVITFDVQNKSQNVIDSLMIPCMKTIARRAQTFQLQMNIDSFMNVMDDIDNVIGKRFRFRWRVQGHHMSKV